jgi:Amt family ammonium transporter
MQARIRKSSLILPVLISALSLSIVAAADDAKPAAPTAPPAAASPKLPPYFSGTNPSNKPEDQKWPDPTGNNAGVWATPAGDGKGDIPSDLKGPDLYDRIAHNMFSINICWAMLTGFLVMFMQAGFAMLEVGLCRPKNAANMASMNLMIYPLGCLAFWIYGFAIGWGNWYNGPVGTAWYSALGPGTSVLNSGLGIGPHSDGSGAFNYGLIGTKGFFLNGVEDVSVLALFFFMMVFFDTTATIPTGAMAERWSWKSFCLFGLWVALPYCLFANWVWGGGFLAQAGKNWGLGHGAVDFAGSGVVHAMGGVIGLAGAICLGPRIGRYLDGKPQAMPAHHIPMVVFGTFILAFGWFGFNPGSTLAGADLRLTSIVVNTMLASVTAGIAAMSFMMIRGLKPDTTMMCNGFLGGLVAITAPCAFVDSMGAAVIGAVAGVLVMLGVPFFDKLQIDDPIGAISVHGINGLWGVISVGIFADGKYGAGWNGVERDAFKNLPGSGGVDGVRGILYGDASQLWAQLLDAGVLVVFGFVTAYTLFKASNFITPLRVTKEVELAGLDGPVMGNHAYPYFISTGSHGEGGE